MENKLKDNGKMLKALAWEDLLFFFEIHPDFVKNDVKAVFYSMA